MSTFVGRYRNLAFLVSVAVSMGAQDSLIGRIREVNGEMAEIGNEQFSASLMREHGAGMTVRDAEEFVEWFVGPSTREVDSMKKLRAKLQDMRRWRWARYQVLCKGNPKIPAENSMSSYSGPE